MKILVCGTSTTMPDMTAGGDHKTWIYHLQQKLKCEIVNISRVGCGNKYIHDAVASEITERKYDLVLTSWTFAKRMDFRIFMNSRLDDWERLGGNPHVDLLQKNWVFPHTKFNNEEMNDARVRLFKGYFPICAKPDDLHQSTLLNIISLQSILKAYNIPYVFTFYRKLLRLRKFSSYYKKIDWDNVHNYNLFNEAKNMDQWNSETLHPTDAAYRWYADEMYSWLSTKNLIKS